MMDLSWSSPAVGVKQLDGAVEVSVSQPPDGDTAAVLCSATSTSRHVVCLCGTVASDGFYIVTSVTDNGATLVLKPTADNSLWQTTYGIVQEIHENNNFYIDKFPPTASADGSAGAIFVPQPLLFHCRVSIFGIDQVDTVNQTFRTEFYTDMRLRGMLHVADEAVGYALMTSFQLSTGLIAFMNVSEMVHDREVWSSINEGIEKDRPTFTIKMRLKVCLNEQMELENFPFDIQELNIPLTFNGSSNRIRLKSNSQYPSLFFCHQFQLASIYNVVYKDVVPTVVSLSDPRESSAGIMYPRCNFKVGEHKWPHTSTRHVSSSYTL